MQKIQEKRDTIIARKICNRLKRDSRIAKIFSSKVHGDPATPLFRAYAGDRVIFRTMMPADKPRNVGFCIHGHEWKEQPEDPHSRIISVQGVVSIGNTFNLEFSHASVEKGLESEKKSSIIVMTKESQVSM